jgi:CrcB protein
VQLTVGKRCNVGWLAILLTDASAGCKVSRVAALLVGLGGAFGSLLRFGVNFLCAQLGPAWPFATTIVNVLGSFGLAFASRSLADRTWLGVPLIWTVGTGVFGGFTTYSSFNLEILQLFQRGDSGRAVAYVCVTLVGCLAAGTFGLWCASRVAL